MDKVLIVDGHALLFQSFYGMPNKIKNSHNQNIEAVICFIGILLKILKLLNPQKLLVVFDGENELERTKINSEYKNNRLDYSNICEEENPFSQLELIKKVLNSLKFSFIETTDNEADDYIAELTNYLKNNFEVIINSPDKDFLQLITINVKCFVYRGKVSKLWDTSAIIDYYGFKPQFFTTFKSLVGDPSDNIKGIKGIGIKTATKLIKEYGELQNIINNIEKISPQRTSDLISQNIQKLLNNYKIIDLKEKNTKYYCTDNLNYEISKLKTIEILKMCDLA